MELIEMKNITKIYSVNGCDTKVLTGVNLLVRQGEFVAVMGRSGSGKSTLLNLIGLLDKPSSGDYFLKGRSVTDLSVNESAALRNGMFGFVMQDFALVEHYTVKQNVMIPLGYTKNKTLKKTGKEQLYRILSKLGIAEMINTPVCLLSGGQRQRTAIARAIICDPDIILADEPTGALDSATAGEIMELLQSIHQQGKTIILVTHDEKIASTCDRIVRIGDGMIVE